MGKIAGGLNGCQSATQTFQKWIPRTCDAENDYHAITEDFEQTTKMKCCNNENLCNSQDDYSQCTEAPKVSSYFSDLNVCWNKYKKKFMAELLCDNDGKPNRDILSWGLNCTQEDGSWEEAKRGDITCRYKATCAEEMREWLKKFGECACTAAKDNGYTGDFIGTALETNWQRFCPKVELSCASDTGMVEVIYKYFVVKAKFIVDVAKSLITEEMINKIKDRISIKLNVDPNTITITFNDDPTTRRRLADDQTSITASFQTEDKNTVDYAKSNMDNSLATSIGNDIGHTVTKDGDTTDEEAQDTTTGNYESNGNVWNVNLVTFIAAFVGIAAFFN